MTSAPNARVTWRSVRTTPVRHKAWQRPIGRCEHPSAAHGPLGPVRRGSAYARRMPHTPGIEIRRAWRQKDETGRIHYIITTHEGVERRLWEPDDSAFGRLLDEALQSQGYTGPKSAQEH